MIVQKNLDEEDFSPEPSIKKKGPKKVCFYFHNLGTITIFGVFIGAGIFFPNGIIIL